MDDKNDKNSNIYLRLLEEIAKEQKETRKCVTKLDKKVDHLDQKMTYELEKIHAQDEIQNKELAEHAGYSRALQAQNELTKKEIDAKIFGIDSPNPEKSIQGRIERLEEPRKWFKMTKNILLGVGAVAGAIYTIGRISGWF